MVRLTDNGIYSTDSLERGCGDSLARIPTASKLPPQTGLRRSELSDTNISALAFDEDQNLWVGYFDRGLDVFDSRAGD